MQRNEQTTMAELRIGDRFYKASDSGKIVFEKVAADDLKKFFPSNTHFGKRDGQRFPEPVKAATAVIFLRSTIDSHEEISDQ